MRALLCSVLFYAASGVSSDLSPPGCGTNDVGFDYTTLPKQTRKRIVGGENATPHSFPWMAALEYFGTFLCGGSLLKGSSDRWFVLTAAHCLQGTSASYWKVRLGVHDLSKTESSSESIDVKKVLIHPQYNNSTYEYDIGLIELRSAPQLSRPEINIGCVSGEVAKAGDVCYVIGWGFAYPGGHESDLLQLVEKPVLSQADCSNIYGPNIFSEASMICAGGESGKDSCTKDSGGPLMCYRNNRMEIIGIVSLGEGCGGRYPGIYASASAGKQWIEASISE